MCRQGGCDVRECVVAMCRRPVYIYIHFDFSPHPRLRPGPDPFLCNDHSKGWYWFCTNSLPFQHPLTEGTMDLCGSRETKKRPRMLWTVCPQTAWIPGVERDTRSHNGHGHVYPRDPHTFSEGNWTLKAYINSLQSPSYRRYVDP